MNKQDIEETSTFIDAIELKKTRAIIIGVFDDVGSFKLFTAGPATDSVFLGEMVSTVSKNKFLQITEVKQ